MKIQLERESRDHGFISIKSKGADKSLKYEDLSRENDLQIPPGVEKQVVTLEESSVAESEKKKKSSEKTYKAKKNQKRGTIRKETPGVLLQEAPESPILSSPPPENDEHYNLN